MKTTEQAVEEIAREDYEKYQAALDDMIATEEDESNRIILQHWKTLPPQEI